MARCVPCAVLGGELATAGPHPGLELMRSCPWRDPAGDRAGITEHYCCATCGSFLVRDNDAADVDAIWDFAPAQEV